MPNESPNRDNYLQRAEERLRYCAVAGTPPSTRVVSAFDAIYLCCMHVNAQTTRPRQDELCPNQDVVLAALDSVSAGAWNLSLPLESVDLVMCLMRWCLFGLEEDMPCDPERAIELAEEVVSRARQL
jgi:hypothetical protein